MTTLFCGVCGARHPAEERPDPRWATHVGNHDYALQWEMDLRPCVLCGRGKRCTESFHWPQSVRVRRLPYDHESRGDFV